MGKNDNQPLVSVIMATFNEPVEFLSQAIESILHQTYSHLELLIADDSTKEETKKAIDKYANEDTRVSVIREKTKMGIAVARNRCFQAAKGKFIAIMDADDISLPDRIERQIQFAQSHPDIDLFGGHVNIINEKGEIVTQRTYKTTPNRFLRMFVYRNPLAHPTVFFRRKIIDEGYSYDENFKKAEDLEFYLRLFKNGFHLINMDTTLINYRIIGDMQKKRTYDNWYYNHKARTKNFNWRHPFFSILSWCVSYVYMYVPSKFVSSFYKKENNRNV